MPGRISACRLSAWTNSSEEHLLSPLIPDTDHLTMRGRRFCSLHLLFRDAAPSPLRRMSEVPNPLSGRLESLCQRLVHPSIGTRRFRGVRVVLHLRKSSRDHSVEVVGVKKVFDRPDGLRTRIWFDGRSFRS